LPVDRELTSNQQPATNNPDSGLRPGEFWANKDISFELRRGECIGLIGHNGAGKTTLLKMLNGLIKPDEGTIEMRGRVGALIALGAGFNPILTGRENIYVNGSILGFTKKEIDSKINEVIDFAEIPEFIDTPVQSYSSGMQVRLGFAVASSMSPDILLLDEVLAVGDNAFKVKCLKRISEMRRTCATIFVSHEAFQVAKIASRVLWLDHGKTLKDSPDVNASLSEYELMGITRSMKMSYNNSQIVSNGLVLEVNGQPVHQEKIVVVSAQEPIKFSMHFDPIKIDDDIKFCEIRTTIQDSGGNPVANIQCGYLSRYYVIASNQLMNGTSIHASLPRLPLADGVYHIRISVAAKGTDDYMFYSERAGSITVCGYGHGWYKTVLAGTWDQTA